jgi:hypothetical protein
MLSPLRCQTVGVGSGLARGKHILLRRKAVVRVHF